MMKPAAYLVGGILIGFGTAYMALEDRFGKKYAEMANANRRAYERAASLKMTEEVFEDEGQLEMDFNEMTFSGEPVELKHTGDTVIEPEVPVEKAQLSAENPYHKAVEKTVVGSTAEQPRLTVVNDVPSVSYIEEEEFEDEDGFTKFHVDFIMNDSDPIFLMDGTPLHDWASRLGDTILVDMFQRCPPGTPPILYVRNHRTTEDYEVVRVEP